jgi:hypothetical protein
VPSIATGPGETATLTVGDASVRVSGSTWLAIRTAADGSIDLDLEQGRVDCDVTPRRSRPRFAVHAADVDVLVVGTAFSVERDGDEVKVQVTRGKVAVARGGKTMFLSAGDSWATNSRIASRSPDPDSDPDPDPDPDPDSDPDPDPDPDPATAPRPRPHPPRPTLSSELDLLRRARNALRSGDPSTALQLLDDHARHHPSPRLGPEAAAIRVEATCAAGNASTARQLQDDLVRRWPDSPLARRPPKLCGGTP